MNPITLHVKKPIIMIILILSFGCATREDFRQSFIARYVKEGEYTNRVKGFSLKWPDADKWVFRNYPEFDLSFDHMDGRSQILIVGVNGLIRRKFPDGFNQWIMDRLQARSIKQISREDITREEVNKFRIVSQSEFAIKRARSLGVHRTTDALFLKRNNHWVVVMCICPVESYEQKKPLFEAVFDSISML